MVVNKGDVLTLNIDDTTIYGTGVCKVDGFVVFVENAVKGDVVEIKVQKVKKKFCYGKIIKLIKKSALRINSDCVYFYECGGCALRHIKYSKELKIKQQEVKNNLKKIGKIDFLVKNCITDNNEIRYRNKCVYQFSAVKNNVFTGFFSKNTHNVINIKDCLLEPNIFKDIRCSINEFFSNKGVSTYSYKTNIGILRHLFLRIDSNENIFVGLVITSDSLPFENEFKSLLTNKFPCITNVFINVNKNKSPVHFSDNYKIIFNSNDTLTYNILDTKLSVSSDSFFQINTNVTNMLYKVVKDVCTIDNNDIVLDIYCGVGSIGLSCFKNAKKLYGVEIVKSAINNAKINADVNNISNTKFICDNAKNSYDYIEKTCTSPTVVVIDPPRSGCDSDLLNIIIDKKPKKVVMVSCNSSTMSRDVKVLLDNGYVLKSVTPVNMFPKTSHVESVVLMSRVKK